MLRAFQFAQSLVERVHSSSPCRGEAPEHYEQPATAKPFGRFESLGQHKMSKCESVSNLTGVLMVGLTGGIGSGKSTVAAMLTERGAVVIDADAIARKVVEPGMPALAHLVERFGPEILQADGCLDRTALAERAFVSDESRKDLEAITHPAIGEEFLREIAAAPEGGIVVHDVPLLVESKRGLQYDGVIVVEAPRATRLDRLEARGIARDDAERRIAMQASDEERRAVATWVLDNSGDVADLEEQVGKVWAELQEMAREKRTQTPAKP
jgi:dephospho-CoA kinase